MRLVRRQRARSVVLGNRLLVTERPPLETKIEKMPVRRAHRRAGLEAEDRHDLVAVEIRSDPLEVFLLRQLAWVVVWLVLMMAAMSRDYRRLANPRLLFPRLALNKLLHWWNCRPFLP